MTREGGIPFPLMASNVNKTDMRTIIRVTMPDGSFGYVHRTFPTISYTDNKLLALRMDNFQAMRIALALGTLGIPHSMETRSEWPEIETSHICLTK